MSWFDHLKEETRKPYFTELNAFLRQEREEHVVYPPHEKVFAALSLTPLLSVRAVILGQDPYHGPGQAHGLSFSVSPNVQPPPSLLNIYKELNSDLGCPKPKSGSLIPWAEQGVLLLNTVLTVRAREAASHRGRGWEEFTDAIIRLTNDTHQHVAFILWGSSAREKKTLIDTSRHTVIESAHPSPLSAFNGFFGSKPFSKTNTALRTHGQEPINWILP